MFSFSLPDFPPGASPKVRRLFWGGVCLGGGLFILWLILSFLPSSVAYSGVSDSAGTVAEEASSDDSVAGGGVTVFTPGRIFMLVLLAAGGAYALYLQRQTQQRPSPPSHLQSIGQLSVGTDQQLQLVRCHDEVLLIGVTEQEITLLREYPEGTFTDPDELPTESNGTPAFPNSAAAPSPNALSGFARVLRQYAQRNPNA